MYIAFDTDGYYTFINIDKVNNEEITLSIIDIVDFKRSVTKTYMRNDPTFLEFFRTFSPISIIEKDWSKRVNKYAGLTLGQIYVRINDPARKDYDVFKVTKVQGENPNDKQYEITDLNGKVTNIDTTMHGSYHSINTDGTIKKTVGTVSFLNYFR